jgi:hypothetical protein
MQSYDKIIQDAELKLRDAEKMLHRDERTFNEFLKKYMKDNKERENRDQVTKNQLLSHKRDFEGRIRDTKLKISSVEQSIFQLEDTVNDQNRLKALLAPNFEEPRPQAVKKGDKTLISCKKNKNFSEDGTGAIKPIDILNFVLKFVGLEEKNFNLMQEIQKREELLIEMRRSRVDCSARATRL